MEKRLKVVKEILDAVKVNNPNYPHPAYSQSKLYLTPSRDCSPGNTAKSH